MREREENITKILKQKQKQKQNKKQGGVGDGVVVVVVLNSRHIYFKIYMTSVLYVFLDEPLSSKTFSFLFSLLFVCLFFPV